VHHNDTAIAVAAILDTRMKGTALMDALVKSKAHGIISKELKDQGAIQEAAVQVEVQSVPEKSIIILIISSTIFNVRLLFCILVTVLSRHYLKKNKEGNSPATAGTGTQNITLKAYLEQVKEPATKTGCLACIWKGKGGSPMYETAMKYSPGVYATFGSSSVKICISPDSSQIDKDKWRNTAVFLRSAPSHIF
jgi:hypothetical protein